MVIPPLRACVTQSETNGEKRKKVEKGESQRERRRWNCPTYYHLLQKFYYFAVCLARYTHDVIKFRATGEIDPSPITDERIFPSS